MGVDALLHRPVVVGHDGEDGIRARGRRLSGQLDRPVGGIGAGAGDDMDPLAGSFDSNANEQFALGGVNNVRGYFEGDEYGDAGWFGSAEVRTPFITARVPSWSAFVPAWVRGSIFVDGGQRFMFDRIAGLDSSKSLLGAGFGLSANINNHLDMRITVGWPLLDTFNTRAGDPRVYFSLGGQF